MANSEVPYQMGNNVASELRLHCLSPFWQFLGRLKYSKMGLFKFLDKYCKKLKRPNI